MCIFCKIINNEIPCYKIYEDKLVIAFLDISQATIGHTLVVPKKHFSNIFELDENTAAKLFAITTRIAKAIKTATNVTSLNILNNNGPLAGQSVEHFHIHIIPRYENDLVNFSFSHNELSNDKFIVLLNNIKKSMI